jgi:tyrosine-protein phosphatase YwqE
MRICVQCGHSLFGRRDKKFCNDFCRNTFNNNLNKENVEVIRITNSRLKKNHKILKNLLENNVTTITKSELMLLEFDLNLNTGFEIDNGKIKRKVYDFNLDQNDDETLSIGLQN